MSRFTGQLKSYLSRHHSKARVLTLAGVALALSVSGLIAVHIGLFELGDGVLTPGSADILGVCAVEKA